MKLDCSDLCDKTYDHVIEEGRCTELAMFDSPKTKDKINYS